MRLSQPPGPKTGEPTALNEWVVLALLAESPSHGFALARQLEPDTDLGRILTVHRPLVYRAIDRLVEGGMARRSASQQRSGGSRRRPVSITSDGSNAVAAWLQRPVKHVRDLRIEFLVKLRLLERSGVDSAALVQLQQAALAERLEALSSLDAGEDVVERWRRHNAQAVSNFLNETP